MTNMFQRLIAFDQKLFLELNSHHNSFFDFVMWWVSDMFIWIPLYLFLAYKIFTCYRRSYKWIFLFIVITITASDQISSNLLKNTVQRPRPTHEASIMNQVHTLHDYKGGPYGFASSHAANSFALAGFLFFLFKKRFKYLHWLLIIWAAIVSYSRIYLGVHYPLDIICGGIIGFSLGAYMHSRYRYYFIKVVNLDLRSISKPWKNIIGKR